MAVAEVFYLFLSSLQVQSFPLSVTILCMYSFTLSSHLTTGLPLLGPSYHSIFLHKLFILHTPKLHFFFLFFSSSIQLHYTPVSVQVPMPHLSYTFIALSLPSCQATCSSDNFSQHTLLIKCSIPCPSLQILLFKPLFTNSMYHSIYPSLIYWSNIQSTTPTHDQTTSTRNVILSKSCISPHIEGNGASLGVD